MELFRIAAAGLAALVVTWALSVMVARSRAPVDAAGWRQLMPGAMHWTALGLCGGLFLMMLYVRLFVGSTRADAASQMTVLSWLTAGFGLGTLVSAWAVLAVLRRPLRWRGGKLAFTGPKGPEQRHFDEVAQLGLNAMGQAVLTFSDGAVLKLDPNAKGASELLEKLRANLQARGQGTARET